MVDLIEAFLERITDWPKEAQAEVVKAIVDIETKYFGIHKLNAKERAAIERGLEEMRQGKFASDEEVTELFNRYRS